MKVKKVISLFIVFFTLLAFSGCQRISDVQVKLGLKNQDFDYIKKGKITKIVIQSTRDKGFRFVVTSPTTINEIYDILSSAKAVSTKSTLPADYTFDLYRSEKVKYDSFSYIAGLDKNTAGNLYNGKKSYIVSKRIDNDILSDFWDTDAKRVPASFNKIYYNLILDALTKYEASGADKNTVVGINLNNDVEALKFILSTDLEDFKKKIPQNAVLLNSNTNTSDTVITETIYTRGYNRENYKAKVVFYNSKTNVEKDYYVTCKYKDSSWDIAISETEPEYF